VVAPLRLLRFAKTTAFISALWTICCAMVVIVLQAKAWWRDGSWNSLSILAVVRGEPEVTYSTASYSAPTMIDRLLDLPALVPLLLAAMALFALYGWLAEVERRSSDAE
jgi:hypothetical protein